MTPYPFSALVGQDDLRLALLLNAVSPAIGGVLVRGEKGTAKSTAVRALAGLLPQIDVIEGCPFNCDPDAPNAACPAGPHRDTPRARKPLPLVELPVGASTDRVAGSLDIERALTQGIRAFAPGLLATAHRGVLYVDEVNLLGDHLVDLLLDAAALGTNHVEREGVSVRHPSRFLLVGTMNPEEGELRPQLLDRFGITVEVKGNADPAERVEIVRRRLAFEEDPEGFAAAWRAADVALTKRVLEARERLGGVRLPPEMLERVVAVCAAFAVDGLRADIVTAKTARVLAAWEGRDEVTLDDVRRAALLALPHRRRRAPFEEPGLGRDDLERALNGDEPDPPRGGRQQHQPTGDGAGRDGGTADPVLAGAGGSTGPSARERTLEPGEPFTPVVLEVPGVGAGALGRRSRAQGDRGHPVGERDSGDCASDLSIPGTLRAAAPHQVARGRSGPGLILRSDDLRRNIREGREGNLVLFVVDASGSMAARRRMAATKGAVLSLLLDAYQRRDRVGLVTFRGEGAQLLLPPTSSVEIAATRLAALPTGGRTPLAAGLVRAAEVLTAEAIRDPKRRPLLVLMSDARANTGAPDPVAAALRAATGIAARGVPAVVIDTEDGPVRLGIARDIAAALRAPCLRIEELAAAPLAGIVRLMVGLADGRVA